MKAAKLLAQLLFITAVSTEQEWHPIPCENEVDIDLVKLNTLQATSAMTCTSSCVPYTTFDANHYKQYGIDLKCTRGTTNGEVEDLKIPQCRAEDCIEPVPQSIDTNQTVLLIPGKCHNLAVEATFGKHRFMRIAYEFYMPTCSPEGGIQGDFDGDWRPFVHRTQRDQGRGRFFEYHQRGLMKNVLERLSNTYTRYTDDMDNKVGSLVVWDIPLQRHDKAVAVIVSELKVTKCMD